jgi:hypothetical protein
MPPAVQRAHYRTTKAGDLADRAVLPAVEGWTFNPATSDGAAVDWHNGESETARLAEMGVALVQNGESI